MPQSEPTHPVIVQQAVQWGEMDAMGHVNSTVFLQYFEAARMLYLDRCGFLAYAKEHGVGPILHSANCRYRQALTFPDTILIAARASDLEQDRFTMHYEIVSQSKDFVAASGQEVVVSYDYTSWQKTKLPEAIREGIERLETSKKLEGQAKSEGVDER